MKAIILAAGKGTRMMPYTQDVPKCLIEHKPGKTFLQHQIGTLRSAGIKDIIIVVGYRAELIEEACKHYKNLNITFFHNIDYENSGALNSMSLARDMFDDDLIVLNSDIIYQRSCLKDVMRSEEICVSMEQGRYELDATCIKVSGENVIDIGFLDASEASGLSVGIMKFPKKYIEEVKNFLTDYPVSLNCFTFNLINHFLEKQKPVNYILCDFGCWCEIDTPEDLNLYKDTIDILLG